MKILFIASSKTFWLAELTHPYWNFSEREHEIVIASPQGGKINPDPSSDPYFKDSWEKEDIVSKGFLSDPKLVALLENTQVLNEVDLESFDAVHVVGGGGAAVDLYPNDEVKKALEHFWNADKFVGTICHGSIALGNIPDLVKGKAATGFSRAEDAMIEEVFGANFIPNFPQPIMEEAGIIYEKAAEPYHVHVVVTGKLITGQNQQSATEYAVAYNHLLAGESPVVYK
ncbi:type 1 glutamine amidotransferase domain-containing protein [Mucilaginibacter sp. 22184]|uniref:type 1 glutamine amidotransferase domain-containing protein n=1 Tax=Mucilaginibacter sp. 22184 TaxID=3453887 RepID=UPI003F83BDC5